MNVKKIVFVQVFEYIYTNTCNYTISHCGLLYEYQLRHAK